MANFIERLHEALPSDYKPVVDDDKCFTVSYYYMDGDRVLMVNVSCIKSTNGYKVIYVKGYCDDDAETPDFRTTLARKLKNMGLPYKHSTDLISWIVEQDAILRTTFPRADMTK